MKVSDVFSVKVNDVIILFLTTIGKTAMKKLLGMMLALSLSAPVWANDYANYTDEELRKLCEFQKKSLQRERNGTPACTALKKRGK